MKVTIPFFYTAKLVRGKKRKSSNYAMIASETFDIAELPSVELSLAISLKRKRFAKLPDKNISSDVWKTDRIDYYCFNGTLVKPFYPDKGIYLDFYTEATKDIEPLAKENIQSYWDRITVMSKMTENQKAEHARLSGEEYIPDINDMYSNNPLLINEDVYRKQLLLPALDEKVKADIIEWVEDDRNQIFNRIKNAVENCCVVNGVLYTPTNPPCWIIDNQAFYHEENLSHHSQWLVKLTACPDSTRTHGSRAFNVFDREAAVANGEQMLQQIKESYENLMNNYHYQHSAKKIKKPSQEKLSENGEINVFLPEFLRKQISNEKLLDATNSYLDFISGKIIFTPPSAIRAYADLKEKYLEVHENIAISEEDTNKLIGLVENLHRLYSIHKNQLNELDNHPLSEFLTDQKKMDRDDETKDTITITSDDLDDINFKF